MKQIFLLLIFHLLSIDLVLFDFTNSSDLSNWYVVDDVVMGGRSQGDLEINDKGHAVFQGQVSLENNGGFSSVRHNFDKMDVSKYSKISIRLKGDKKQYQFRVKSNRYERHSYTTTFETSGEWQTIEIPFKVLEPSFRGRKLKMNNYSGKDLVEIAFLIGNKKAETFILEIDKIILE